MGKEELLTSLKGRIEQVAVVIVAFLILLYLIVVGVTESDAERVLKRSDEQLSAVERIEKNAGLPEQVTVTYKEDLQEVCEKNIQFIDGADWFAYKRPFVLISYRIRPPDEGELHPASLEVALDGMKIKLSWTDSEMDRNIVITGYRLMRKSEDDKDFKLLRRFSATRKEYIDTDTEPGTKYSYKLFTTATLDPAKKFIKWVPPQVGVSGSSASVPSEAVEIQTPFPYQIKVRWKLPDGRVKIEIKPTLVEGRPLEESYVLNNELQMLNKDGKKKIGIGYRLIEYKEGKGRERDYIVIEHTKSGRRWKVERTGNFEEPIPLEK